MIIQNEPQSQLTILNSDNEVKFTITEEGKLTCANDQTATGASVEDQDFITKKFADQNYTGEGGSLVAGTGITITGTTSKTIAVDTDTVAEKATVDTLIDTVNTLSGTVTDLGTTVAGKVDTDQGTANAGKVLTVGTDGNVAPAAATRGFKLTLSGAAAATIYILYADGSVIGHGAGQTFDTPLENVAGVGMCGALLSTETGSFYNPDYIRLKGNDASSGTAVDYNWTFMDGVWVTKTLYEKVGEEQVATEITYFQKTDRTEEFRLLLSDCTFDITNS